MENTEKPVYRATILSARHNPQSGFYEFELGHEVQVEDGELLTSLWNLASAQGVPQGKYNIFWVITYAEATQKMLQDLIDTHEIESDSGFKDLPVRYTLDDMGLLDTIWSDVRS